VRTAQILKNRARAGGATRCDETNRLARNGVAQTRAPVVYGIRRWNKMYDRWLVPKAIELRHKRIGAKPQMSLIRGGQLTRGAERGADMRCGPDV
jgi:hypothetical protein